MATRRMYLAPLLAIALLAGCSGDERRVDPARLAETVLQPADVSEGYRQFDEGALVGADSPRGEAGWKARYRWTGDASASVPLVVESRVDLFDSTDAAKEGLRALRGELEGEARELSELGDQAAVATFTREAEPAAVRFFTVVWRDRNAVASVALNGFDGRIDEAQALELARKQAERLGRA